MSGARSSWSIRTTYACTWASCAPSWRTTPRIQSEFSRNRAWDIGSRTPRHDTDTYAFLMSGGALWSGSHRPRDRHMSTTILQEHASAPSEATGRRLATLTLAALGIVYGDIGTSPLYAFKESIGGEHAVGVGVPEVLGVLSMMFWAVTLVVSLKYVLIVLRAGNDGEGGILALLALVLRQLPAKGRITTTAIFLGLFGASMFYGDSVITPAISVLSAVEGLDVLSPQFSAWIVPLTIAILIGLFAFQRFGTARVGGVFGPVMLVWFAVIGALGALQIAHEPAVLGAVDPVHAVAYIAAHPGNTLVVLAAVFLAVTGGEALYADMG